jgi:hypothetical protein
MAASDVEVRAIRADERADWEPLWKGYQAFYKVEISDETTTVTWARLHDPAEPMAVLGAYMAGASAASCTISSTARAGRSATTATCRTCSSPKTPAIWESGVR